MSPDRQLEGGENRHREPLLENVSAITERLARLCGEAAGRVELAYHNLSRGARDVSRRMQDRAKRMKNEKPLQTVAMIGAIAFVAGIILRIWRSQHK
jgi:ElaB/YqjD/DUF883 family membrane-anchored ribosome-binding protein